MASIGFSQSKPLGLHLVGDRLGPSRKDPSSKTLKLLVVGPLVVLISTNEEGGRASTLANIVLMAVTLGSQAKRQAIIVLLPVERQEGVGVELGIDNLRHFGDGKSDWGMRPGQQGNQWSFPKKKRISDS